ncbi:MAG: DUF4225 domain-containing protein [Enterobacteriaceae bacterium]|nr:DUF4225 domain-containing protein [Enterobacteriaceae bacterium]
MGTAAISYLRRDLEQYALALRRVANLASVFFIDSSISRMDYIQEIENVIIDITRRFNSTFDINERIRLINELKFEFELAEKEYQSLRRGDYHKYIITDIFEDQGILKYAKIAGGVVSGFGQIFGALSVYKFGNTVHSKRIKGISVVLATHGANNIFESVSPLFYDRQEPGKIRDIYRFIAQKMGYDIDEGDLAYSSVDFAVTVYAAYSGMKIVPNKNSLALRSLGDKPGTGRLYKAVSQDFRNAFSLKPTPLKIYQVGDSLKKFKATFIDEEYRYGQP